MSWKDRLLRASFRGVPFYVESSEQAIGRRVQVHQFPGRDRPHIEDLGAQARQFTFQGYIWDQGTVENGFDNNYDLRVREFEQALLQDGPGILHHPYFGEVTVQADQCTRTEGRELGGMAVYSLTFWEVPQPKVVPQEENTDGEIQSSADESLEELLSHMEEILGAPQTDYDRDDLSEAFQDVINALEGAQR